VGKCLEKERERRYGTARELAEDLARFERGEPVEAEPPTLRYLLGKTIRRHKLRFAAAGALLLLALAAAAVSVYRIELARRATELALFDMFTANGIRAGDEGNPARAVLWFANAAPLAQHDPRRAEANRVRIRTYGREARRPVRALPHPGQTISKLLFHPRGEHLLTLSETGKCTVWDLQKEEPLPLPGGDREVTCAAWRREGDRLALAGKDGQIDLLSFPGGDGLGRFSSPGTVTDIAFSPDGRLLAAAAEKARVWDLRHEPPVPQDLELERPGVHLLFNGKGDRLFVGSARNSTAAFAVSEGMVRPRPLLSMRGSELVESLDVIAVASVRPFLVDEDSRLVNLTSDIQLTWWDAGSGKRGRSISFGSSIIAVERSPDGRHVAAATARGTFLCDALTVNEGRFPLGGSSYVPEIAAFSPDSTRIATSSRAGQTVVWSLPGGTPLASGSESLRGTGASSLPEGLGFGCTALAFSPRGDFLAAARPDGLVLLFSGEEGHPQDKKVIETVYYFTRISVSPDGQYTMAIGGLPDSVPEPRVILPYTRVYGVRSGKPVGSPLRIRKVQTGGTFSPDSNRAVTINSGAANLAERSSGEFLPAKTKGQVRFWDWRTGREIQSALSTPSEPQDAAFSQDGKLLVVVCAGGQVLLIDPDRGTIERTLDHGSTRGGESTNPAGNVSISPDGESFVTYGIGNQARVWERASGKVRYPPIEHAGGCSTASFSHDGRFLVTGGADKKAVI
jgi:WD40 repeat protein